MTTTNRVRVVQTTSGQIPADILPSFKLCLSHQILSPALANLPSGRPLTLQNYHHHTTNLLSLENASLVPGLLQHQLQRLVQSSKLTHKEILILDGSSYGAKLSELFERYTVVKGFNYQLEGSLEENKKMGLLSQEHVLKQVDYEFKFGNGKFKPGFIGEIPIDDCVQQSHYYPTFLAYLTFSSGSDCPIFINSLKVGESPLIQQASVLGLQKWQEVHSGVYEKFKLIEGTLKLAKQYNTRKIVFYNIPLLMMTVLDEQSCSQRTTNQTHSYIVDLLDNFQFTLGFDLARYSSVECWNYIALLVRRYPSRIILSAGNRYKTDLSAFGGEGFLLYSQDRSQSSSLGYISKLVGNCEFVDQVVRLNKINLVDWQIRVDEVKLVLMWSCSNCANSQPETVQSFRKFGKQFCSIKCLKSFKF